MDLAIQVPFYDAINCNLVLDSVKAMVDVLKVDLP